MIEDSEDDVFNTEGSVTNDRPDVVVDAESSLGDAGDGVNSTTKVAAGKDVDGSDNHVETVDEAGSINHIESNMINNVIWALDIKSNRFYKNFSAFQPHYDYFILK